MLAFGRPVYGFGVATLGGTGLMCADFVLGQPVSKHQPARLELAYAAGALMLLGGAALWWRRTAAAGAATLAAYFGFVVVVLMNGRVAVAQYNVYGTYSGIAEQVAIAAGALIIYAAHARMDPVLARRLTRGSQIVFGVCAMLFGGAHFAYLNLTAPLVPRWLPPNQVFWAYLTGAAFFLAGLAIVAGVRTRPAAIGLTVMVASFAILIHWPMLAAAPTSQMNWVEAATNLAILGVAWIVAEYADPR